VIAYALVYAAWCAVVILILRSKRPKPRLEPRFASFWEQIGLFGDFRRLRFGMLRVPRQLN
jgi:hypothetical protein